MGAFPGASTLEQADNIFNDFHSRGLSPGLTYAIAKDGEVLQSRSFGQAILASSYPVSVETMFPIASMTKSFTAAAVLLLRDRGAFSLESRVGDALTPKPVHPSLRRLTVHSLLSMTADLPTDDPWGDRQLGVSDSELDDILLREVAYAGLGDRRCSYSNLGYMILGRILSHAANCPAQEFISRELLAPLGLRHTSWSPSEHSAQGYVGRGAAWVSSPSVSSKGDAAVFAGLWSTTADVARWLAYLCERPGVTSKLPLSRESRRELRTGHAWLPPSPFRATASGAIEIERGTYALGLRASEADGLHFIHHSGGLPGYGGHMRTNEETGISVVAFANARYCPVWEPCRDALFSLCRGASSLGLPFPSPASPPERRSAASQSALTRRGLALGALLADWDDLLANELFADNFFMDWPRELFRSALEKLHSFVGPDPIDTRVIARFGLRAELRVEGPRGEAILDFSLAPHADGKIQSVATSTVLAGLPEVDISVSLISTALRGERALTLQESTRADLNVLQAALSGFRDARLLSAEKSDCVTIGVDGEQAWFKLTFDASAGAQGVDRLNATVW